MTDPDAVGLFLYSECGQQEKNSEGTDLILGLDRLTGLESILPHGLPKDVLYICSKEKKYFAKLLQKDSWWGIFNWDSNFLAVNCTKLLQRMIRQTHD